MRNICCRILKIGNSVGYLSYPMNPYELRTCAVGSSCHVLTDLKWNIVEFSAFVVQFPSILQTTNSWYITYPKMVTLPADNQSVSMRLVPSSNRVNLQSWWDCRAKMWLETSMSGESCGSCSVKLLAIQNWPARPLYDHRIGFFHGVFAKKTSPSCILLGSDWSGWIVSIESEILIKTGIVLAVSSDKWKAP